MITSVYKKELTLSDSYLPIYHKDNQDNRIKITEVIQILTGPASYLMQKRGMHVYNVNALFV